MWLKKWIHLESESFEISQGPIPKEWTTVSESYTKNHQEPISQFVLPKNFIHKVILACHDHSGHLGMEKDSKVVAREVLLAQDGR